jgi:phytoene dehydrogenase-like protein
VGPPDADHPVVIVGAGLAGLCCAIELDRVGVDWLVLEAGDAVGGRLRTDSVDGFRLDRGFQVLLTAYPECQRLLDYGALLRVDGGFHRVSDPFRRPAHALATAAAPIGGLVDKGRVALLRTRLQRRQPHTLLEGPERTTLQYLVEAGFSQKSIDAFFRPLFAGIQLDPSLSTSSRAFEFVFAMLARGDNTVPSGGIQAIGEQLASRLAADRVRLSARVQRIEADHVVLDGGGQVPASAVVIATDGPSAAGLSDAIADPGSKGVGCLYFSADEAPLDEPVLVLDAGHTGPVNNLTVISRVAPSYSPSGAELISASVIEDWSTDDVRLVPAVRDQLRRWFGGAVDGWRHIRTDRVPHAQPRQTPPALTPPERPVRLAPGRYVCGDHRDNASINGAMVSGRRAAEAVAADL